MLELKSELKYLFSDKDTLINDWINKLHSLSISQSNKNLTVNRDRYHLIVNLH